MKKLCTIILTLMILFSFCACDESDYINIDVFSKRVNDSFGYDIIDKESLIIINEQGNDYYYWFPKEYDNICVKLKCKKNDVVITEYSAIFSGEYSKRPDDFLNKLKSAVNKNNEWISLNEYKSENGYIQVFSDLRFKEDNTNPTLKREIKNDDITFPVFDEKLSDN